MQISLLPYWLHLPINLLDFKAIKHIPSYPFWFFILLLSLFSCYFLYQCYINFLAARKMEDTPTAKIRSASQGYVELEGTQHNLPEQPVYGFLSKLPCTWYRYAISRYKKNRWALLEYGTSDALFLLDDSTGLCLIDPTNAEVTTPLQDCWYGFVLHPNGKPNNIFTKILSSIWGPYRYQEWRMEPGMPLYALGNFKTASEINHLFSQSIRFKKEVEALTKNWKKNKPALLAEFDQDKDGKISPIEWEKVVEKAQKILEQKWFIGGKSTLNLLSAEGLKEPYILAARQQKKLISRLKASAIGWLLAYIVAVVFILWLISIYIN